MRPAQSRRRRWRPTTCRSCSAALASDASGLPTPYFGASPAALLPNAATYWSLVSWPVGSCAISVCGRPQPTATSAPAQTSSRTRTGRLMPPRTLREADRRSGSGGSRGAVALGAGRGRHRRGDDDQQEGEALEDDAERG